MSHRNHIRVENSMQDLYLKYKGVIFHFLCRLYGLKRFLIGYWEDEVVEFVYAKLGKSIEVYDHNI